MNERSSQAQARRAPRSSPYVRMCLWERDQQGNPESPAAGGRGQVRLLRRGSQAEWWPGWMRPVPKKMSDFR